MGEGGAVWFPAPFLQFKESAPRDDPHSEEEGTGPHALRPRWLCSTRSGTREGHGELGPGRGPVRAQQSREERSPLFPSISHEGEQESKDGMFLTWLTGG